MQTYGGSEFGESDFLLFGQKIKELTYNTYLEISLEGDESPGYKENVKEELRKYKLHIKEELLDSYGKKSKFKELNDIVLDAAKSEGYQEVAHSGSDELYDFTGLTEKILKKIGISYVLTEDELDSIRALLGSSGSRAPSRTSSRSSRGSTKRKKKPTKKKKKKKPTKKKKKPTKKKKKPTKKKRTFKKRDYIEGGGFALLNLNQTFEMATPQYQRSPDPRNLMIIMTVTSYSPNDTAGFDTALSSDKTHMCQVTSVVPRGPADLAGVKPGHYFLKLNGVDVTNMTQKQITRLLKKPESWYQRKLGVDNEYTFGPANCLGGHKGCESCAEVVAQEEEKKRMQAERSEAAAAEAKAEIEAKVAAGESWTREEKEAYIAARAGGDRWKQHQANKRAKLQKLLELAENQIESKQYVRAETTLRQAVELAPAAGVDNEDIQRRLEEVSTHLNFAPEAAGTQLDQSVEATPVRRRDGGYSLDYGSKKKRGEIRGGGAKLSARYPPERDPFTGNLRFTVTSYSANDTAGFQTAKSSDKTHMCHVAHVDEGSPAAQAGVRVGDYLLKLNGVDVSKMTLHDTISLLKKPGMLDKWYGVDNVYEFGSDDVRAMNTKLCPSAILDKDLKEDIQDKVRTADEEVLRDMKAYLRTAKPHLQLLEDWLYSSKGSRDTGAPEERVLGKNGKWHELWTKAKQEISAEKAEESGEIAMMGSSSGFGLDDATPAAATPAAATPAAATAIDESVPVKTFSAPSSRPSSPTED